MMLSKLKPHAGALANSALVIGLALGSPPAGAQGAARAAGGPFAGLSGSWSGGGSIKLSNGTSEALRCRATYAVRLAGMGLDQNLICASDSYKFQVRSNVDYNAGAISGTWAETTRRVSGRVSGRAGEGEIEAKVDGGSFSASLAVSTSGNRQTVTIRPQGTDVTEVAVRLQRGSR